MIFELIYTSRSKKSARKLPLQVRKKFEELELTFRINPRSPKLKTHKLHGKFQECHAFPIDQKHRIIFQFLENKKILLLEIGTHEIYE